jgi:hypothetical protein
MAHTAPIPPTPPASSAVPRAVRGRRTDAEQTAIRERVEQLMYQNLRSPAIHRALTGPEAPNPIVISERQVRAQMAVVERAWAERASREHLEAEHAKAIAIAEETARAATVRSTLNARSNVGVGYLNAALKAQELVARLRGLYAPSRTELAGPGGTSLAVSLEVADHPAEHLDPREEARRLRQMAADREAEADEADEAG